MEQAVFPHEPTATHALPRLQRQSRAVAGLGLQALKGQSAQDAMDAAVETVAEVLDNELCKVLELLPDGQALLLRAGVGWQPGLVGRGTVSAGLESQAGYTLMEGRPVVVSELATDTRFNGPPLLHRHGVISGLSTPIYTSRGAWGVIGTHTRKHRDYSLHDQDFLVAVANVLGAAIDREYHEKELNAARERLKQWDQLRARFLHNVAHELRTPLTPLRMQLQYLDGQRESMEPRISHGIQVALRGAQRLEDRIDSFVELTRLQSNAFLLERERIDLARLAREAAAPFQAHAHNQGISLTVEADDEVWIAGEAPSLQRVIAILIDNGLKFTPIGGSVSVKAIREGDFGAISVEDTGAGLRPEQIDRLFQPFSQSTLVEAPAGGLGVGLAIAKETVELHGGQIGAESAGHGQGARFWFTVRLIEGERLTDRIRMR